MADALLNGSDNVGALSYSRYNKRLAVGEADGTVDILFNGVVASTVVTGLAGIDTVAYDRNSLFVSNGTASYWYFNGSSTPVDLLIAGVTDAIFFDTTYDSNPNWTNQPVVKASSWYAEVGEFPQFGLIVATASAVTIYRISNGVPDMWMVFNVGGNRHMRYPPTSLSYSEGVIEVGGAGGLVEEDFAKDSSYLRTDSYSGFNNGNISQRNDALGLGTNDLSQRIVDSQVNAVASTVAATERTNLLLWSEDFTNAAWGANRMEQNLDTQTVLGSPVYQNTITSVSGTPYFRQPNQVTTVSGTTYTAQVVMKAGSWDSQILLLDGGFPTSSSATFDLTDGTYSLAVGADSASIRSLGDGFYLCTVTATANASNANSSPQIRWPNGEAWEVGDYIYNTRIQLEQASNAGQYIKTEATTVTADVPPAKQLVNRTNLIPYSEALLQANSADWRQGLYNGGSEDYWTATAETLDEKTCNKLIATATSSTLFARSNTTFSAGNNTASFSVWIPASVTGAVTVSVDYQDIEGTSAVSVPERGQWVRVESPSATLASSRTWIDFNIKVNGVTPPEGFTFYVSEFQNEYGAAATPYIPTTTTAATVTDDTGLYIPTWAVATDGGVSVGVNTGDVWDITGQTNYWDAIGFTQDSSVVTSYTFASQVGVYPIPTADTTIASYSRRYYPSPSTKDAGAPKVLNDGSGGLRSLAVAGGTLAVSDINGTGLTLITEDLTDYFDGQYSWIKTAYNTGSMKQPDGAWANDTDTTPIGFPFDLYDDFNAPNVTVFSDDFNRTTLAPWVDNSQPTSFVDVSGGELRLNVGATSLAIVDLAQATIVGQWYKFTPIRGAFGTAPNLSYAIGTTQGAGDLVNTNINTTPAATFQATTTTTYFRVYTNSPLDASVNNVTIEEVPALDGWNWPAGSTGTGGPPSIVNQSMQLNGVNSSNRGRTDKAFTTVNGMNYLTTDTAVDGGYNYSIWTGPSRTGTKLLPSVNHSNGTYLNSFVAQGGVAYIHYGTTSSIAKVASITVQQALIENGTFDSDTAWTKGTGWTIASGVASCDGTQVASTDIEQNPIPVEAGKVYRAQYTQLSVTQGSSLIFVDGAGVGTAIIGELSNQLGVWYITFTAIADADIRVAVRGTGPPGTYIGSIDNVIVTEALPDYSIADNPLQVIGQVESVEFVCDPSGSFDDSFD
jgi:hypothetical protein